TSYRPTKKLHITAGERAYCSNMRLSKPNLPLRCRRFQLIMQVLAIQLAATTFRHVGHISLFRCQKGLHSSCGRSLRKLLSDVPGQEQSLKDYGEKRYTQHHRGDQV